MDSGSTLQIPAMSHNLFLKLKDWKILPQTLTLKRTNLEIESADSMPIKSLGILQYPLTFTHKDNFHSHPDNLEPDNNELHITLDKFVIIEGLSNSFNFGIKVLKK